MKRPAILLVTAAAAILLSGCGSVFEKEYVVVDDYTPPVSGSLSVANRITVASFDELRRTLLNMVYEGKEAGSIVFDAAYEGNLAQDMASACWQVRTQDALCAYRVENISYELNKIVTFSEAYVTVSYIDATLKSEDIVQLQFSAGIDELLRQAMGEGKTQLAVLIGQSLFSQEDMVHEVENVYRRQPSLAPWEPSVNVYMFSGTGAQRLYEINLNYGVTDGEMSRFREQLAEISPFAELDAENMPEGLRALAACAYLKDNCRYVQDHGKNGIADALLEGEADSEGMAFAYVELCRMLGLDCQVIYGQREREDYCWNLVYVGGEWYHADVPTCAKNGMEMGFLLTDRTAWNEYRWDVAAYPKCDGLLRYRDLIAGETEPAAPKTENTLQEEISS